MENKISKNAGKANGQSGVVCITNHRLLLETTSLDNYAKRIFSNENYQFDEAYFYIDGHLYKKTKE